MIEKERKDFHSDLEKLNNSIDNIVDAIIAPFESIT